MSKKKIQLNIPEPCHKKFTEMIPAQGGSFCDSCEKIIVDFTNMTDNEIANTFIKNKRKICGQFRKDQLNRKINLTPPPVNFYRGKAASLFLSGVLTAATANAQNNIQPIPLIKNQQITHQNQLEKIYKKDKNPTLNPVHSLKFLVTDTHGEALIGASVILNGCKIGTTTDIDGTAELVIPSEFANEDSFVISVSYTGFQTQEISMNKEEYDFDKVSKVILTEGQLVGILVVTGYAKPTTLYQVVRNWFYKLRYNREERINKREEKRELRKEKRANRKLAKKIRKEKLSPTKSDSKIIQLPTHQFSISLKNISPNPFSDEINLEIFSAIKSDIQISLFDISGQKIYQVTQGVIEGNQNIYLNLKNIRLENGEYILHIKEKSGQVQSRKMIRIVE